MRRLVTGHTHHRQRLVQGRHLLDAHQLIAQAHRGAGAFTDQLLQARQITGLAMGNASTEVVLVPGR